MQPPPQITLRAQSSVTGAQPLTLPWLASRATFGFSADAAAEMLARGHDGWVSWQLQPESIDDSALDAKLAAYPWLDWDIGQIIASGLNTVELADTYKGLRFLRAVESRRQLFERVVEFWADHFNINMGRFFRLVEDRTVWRPLALGRFRDLLFEVETSASMIAYLNNDLNVAGANNENLAREILELHTLGVEGPYTEDDVREFARVLTGWSFDEVRVSPSFGNALFKPELHDYGPKTVLGQTYIADSGAGEFEAIIDDLAMHRDTISFVVGKMARFFLGDRPPQSIVSAAEDTWRQTDGDIRSVLLTLLSEQAFIRVITGKQPAGSTSLRTKFRRPFDWFASVFRATGAPVPDPLDAVDQLRSLGQAPFEWTPPDGYPDDRNRWAGLIAPRWRVAASFARPAGTPWRHTALDILGLVAGVPRAQWADRLDACLTGGRLSVSDRREIQDHIDSFSAQVSDSALLGEALELALSCPSYQTV